MRMGHVLASATLFMAGGASAIGYSESTYFVLVAVPASQAHDSAALMNASRSRTAGEHFAASSHDGQDPSEESFAELSTRGGGSHDRASRQSQLNGGSPGAEGVDTSPTVSAIPEPHIYGVLLAGLGVIGFVARRRARGY